MLCIFNWSELFQPSIWVVTILSWTVRTLFDAHKSWTLDTACSQSQAFIHYVFRTQQKTIETKHAIRRHLWDNWEELYVITMLFILRLRCYIPTWSLETRWPSCLSDQLVVIMSLSRQSADCVCRQATPHSIVYGAYTYSAVQYLRKWMWLYQRWFFLHLLACALHNLHLRWLSWKLTSTIFPSGWKTNLWSDVSVGTGNLGTLRKTAVFYRNGGSNTYVLQPT